MELALAGRCPCAYLDQCDNPPEKFANPQHKSLPNWDRNSSQLLVLITSRCVTYWQQGNGIHADEETGAVMLKIARRVTAGSLEEDIQQFLCSDQISN